MPYFLSQDNEILGWCPAGLFLPYGEEGASLALVGHSSSDGVMIKMSFDVDVLHPPGSHPIFSYWVCLKLNLVFLLYQLRLAQGDERWW